MNMIRTINLIVLSDFDRLVSDTYGRPYSFQQQDGCKGRGIEQYSIPIENPWDYENDIVSPDDEDNMGVSFEAWLARDPSEPLPNQRYDWDLDLFWERNFYPSVEMILADLYKRGLIPAGELAINIDW
jgi:hypothetical protein